MQVRGLCVVFVHVDEKEREVCVAEVLWCLCVSDGDRGLIMF